MQRVVGLKTTYVNKNILIKNNYVLIYFSTYYAVCTYLRSYKHTYKTYILINVCMHEFELQVFEFVAVGSPDNRKSG